MRVCFIGVGSIALRHIRNMRHLYGESICITALRSGEGRALSVDEDRLIDEIIYDYEKMASDYDAIFITNPTSKHYEALCRIIDKSNSFFIEKPVFLTGDEDDSAFEVNNKEFYVACPLRYSNVIQYLKKNIDFSMVYSVRCICSSYLPEWRSGIDYRSTYSAHKELGGGVSIDLIHEWDYLTYLLGFPTSVKSIITKKSDLDIDSDDLALYIAEYPNLAVEVHLDYFGRKPERKVILFAKEDTIVCDLYEQTIHYLRNDRLIDLKESRDEYQKKELLHFMKIVEREEQSDNDLSHACRTLRLARGVL